MKDSLRWRHLLLPNVSGTFVDKLSLFLWGATAGFILGIIFMWFLVVA